jgi:glyoxylase-like metal-dependent hydrolase (beta-lactamase superfamily II)
MATIPLEDSFTDIVGKARRGLKLTDDAQLAAKAGVSAEDVASVGGGTADEGVLRKLANVLELGEQSLADAAAKRYYPRAQSLDGLQQFNTPYEDMTVNAYLAWDPKTRDAVAFDTGATCQPMLDFAKRNQLSIKLVLLTHTHGDHIADLAKITAETRAKAYVGELEPNPGAAPFPEGHQFKVGNLKIDTRLTTGHCVGGITFVVAGLARPVAIVGDAIFAGSMGGGGISYADALANNRKKILTLPDDTIICPGHGPLTTVGEEKRHNPFYPEFQK